MLPHPLARAKREKMSGGRLGLSSAVAHRGKRISKTSMVREDGGHTADDCDELGPDCREAQTEKTCCKKKLGQSRTDWKAEQVGDAPNVMTKAKSIPLEWPAKPHRARQERALPKQENPTTNRRGIRSVMIPRRMSPTMEAAFMRATSVAPSGVELIVCAYVGIQTLGMKLPSEENRIAPVKA